MYKNFYHLKEKPFSIVPSSGNIFLSSKHSQALTHLEYGIRENIGFILLSGDIGTGKTSLIQHMLKTCSQEMEVAIIFNTNTSPEELIKLILAEFEIKEISDDKAANLDRLNTFLIEQYALGKRILLIIDEAQNLSWAALEEVRMLSNLHAEDASLLQIILVGQPELRRTIHEPRLEQLAQRIAVAFHLGPLNLEETNSYIRHRLSKAGSEDLELFEDEAVKLIFEETKGIPRSINILCDAALVYGYAEDSKIIRVEIVNQVISDRSCFELPKKQSYSIEEHKFNNIDSSEELEHRISNLEYQVVRLQEQLTNQQKEIYSELEDSRKGLIRKLEVQLHEERKRNEKLLIFYGQYKDKMKKEAQNNNNADNEQSEITDNDLDSINSKIQNRNSKVKINLDYKNEDSYFFNRKIKYISVGMFTLIILILTYVHVSIQPLQSIIP
jgi:putative secretion ATPase (PEP-CTERM system associated)